MPRDDKSGYTDKQKRRAEHIEESYEKRGTPKRKLKAGPGQLSTRRADEARNPARAEASRKVAAHLPAAERRTSPARKSSDQRLPARVGKPGAETAMFDRSL